MRNQDAIIKAAKKIVDENNKVYKTSAREMAYIIYATDGNGTQDRFITDKNSINERDWKSKFESVGFKNVIVKPFGTSTIEGASGDLNYNDVNPNLFNNATNRPKINYSETPSRKNPYEGTQNIPADSRLSTPSYDKTNELQQFIFEMLADDEQRIRAGWYGGSLSDWLNKLAADSEGTSIVEILDMKFPYMNNSMLEKHLLDKQLSFENYNPSKYEIRYFAIVMPSLQYFLTQPGVEFTDVPEKRVKDQLKQIVEKAKSFKKHKYYAKQEMDKYFEEHQNKIDRNDDAVKDAIFYLMRGMFG